MPQAARDDWLTKVLAAIDKFETSPRPKEESQRRIVRRIKRWRPQPSPLRQVTHIWEVDEEEQEEPRIEDETIAEEVSVSPEEPVVQPPTPAESSRRRRLQRKLKRCVVM